jgi:hypothetical protein
VAIKRQSTARAREEFNTWWGGEKVAIDAMAKLNAMRAGRKGESNVEENTLRRNALLAQKELIESGAGPELDAAARKTELDRIRLALTQNEAGLKGAILQDEIKSVDAQTKKTDQMAKQLGMLSDEDMLQARIMASAIKRGEIKQEIPWAEFSQLSQGERKRFEMFGGKVTGTPFGIGAGGGEESAAAPAGPRKIVSRAHPVFDHQGRLIGYEDQTVNEPADTSAPSAPSQREPIRPPTRPHGGLSASESGGNVDEMAVAIAREMRVQLATLFPIPVKADGTYEPKPLPSGTARGGPR